MGTPKFFFIEVEPYGYGASLYYVITQADSIEEAVAKVKKRYPKQVRESYPSAPCEVVFDNEGVSNLLDRPL